jgi:hypothetical protein
MEGTSTDTVVEYDIVGRNRIAGVKHTGDTIVTGDRSNRLGI